MGKKSKQDAIDVQNDQEEYPALDHGVKKSIFAVLLLMLAVIFILSLVDLAGIVGQHIDKGIAFLFGWGRFVLPLVMIVLGTLYFKKMQPIRYTLAAVGAILFFLMFLGLVHITKDMDGMVIQAKIGCGGGYVGLGIAYPLAHYLGKIAGVIILAGFSLIGIMLIFNAPLYQFIELVRSKIPERKKDKEANGKEGKEDLEDKKDQEDKENGKDAIGEDISKTQNNNEEKNDSQMEQSKQQEDSDEDNKKHADLSNNIKTFSFDDRSEDKLFKTVQGQFLEGKKQDELRQRSNAYAKTLWSSPPFNLLRGNKERPHQTNLDQTVDIIKSTLHNFGIEVEPSEYHIGPTITQFTFKPANGVKLSRILALQDNLALALAAHPVRIEAPIPGKSLIGIEVPNETKSLVQLRTMLESDAFKKRPSNLSIILGEDVNGLPMLADIKKMPHLLIAGSTGTGKSICINAILTTLLYQNSFKDLCLILIDPKRVELSMYKGIPHLLTPVITEPQKVVNTLRWSVDEMEKRFCLLQEVGSRDIHSYNKKVNEGERRRVIDKETGEEKKEIMEKMPYIIIVIDELADLMAAYAKDIEGPIVRLAQKSRAVGIHLIVSTQRPSVEVITGLIKTNIATRVAFQVPTQIDSRTILDMAGAEKLLGNGDMLFLSADAAKPRRVQGVFISEKEIKRVVKFIKEQAKEIDFDDGKNLSVSLKQQLESSASTPGGLGSESTHDEEIYKQAKEIVIQAKKASTSMLQRKLSIGYGRAARIIDILEENGIVGPPDGTKPRKLLIDVNENVLYGNNNKEDQKKRDKWARDENVD
ncbi:MAG: DNA translocase FtsK 4TM domain-containing protein [Patescibacteria group bacterium]|nr:DNA translocase FtsK 4TM domain-containing protein [Patescibacteria group bacterium]